jgi:nitrogen-specific signal transduction histidine kinase
VFRDITNQQRLENELLKMEKLKSLGVLAGGIAHDFNNFLTGILGNLSLAKMDLQPGNPVSRSLNEMEKAAVRAKDLTQQLLTFSKGGKPVKRTIIITKLVREAAQFALHGSNVQCKFDINEKLMPVDVDEGQIAQVIQNLIINADQAMPNGGTIWIRGVNVRLAKGNPFALSPGSFVKMTVRDQGMGIHPDYIKKVFDPYFTTKQKGSGLGLSAAYNIVAKHDGQLTVDSELGEGTTFTILLPASTISPKTYDEKREEIVTGQGRVLVMDDEDYIRELASAMLSKLGYEVAAAKDGQIAVDLYKQAIDEGSPFDAVILDLTVPGGMGGKETIKRLNEIDKNVRAIVSSGYSNDPVISNYTHYGFRGAVQKPYLLQEMSQVLRSVIGVLS